MIEEAKALVKESEAAHSGGSHARSEAKAAKWLAEPVR